MADRSTIELTGKFKIARTGNSAIARIKPVKAAIRVEVNQLAGVAKAILAAEGGSGRRVKIKTASGKVDGYVVMEVKSYGNVNFRGANPALSVEFGHNGFVSPDTEEPWGGADGKFILTRALFPSASVGRRRPPGGGRTKNRPRKFT